MSWRRGTPPWLQRTEIVNCPRERVRTPPPLFMISR
jgi:hypothetical protein